MRRQTRIPQLACLRDRPTSSRLWLDVLRAGEDCLCGGVESKRGVYFLPADLRRSHGANATDP